VTIVVAVKCPEGVVLATDSQGTAQMSPLAYPVKLPVKKIKRLGKSIVYGSTGGSGLAQRVHFELDKQAGKLGSAKGKEQVADIIRPLAIPLMQQARKEWVQLPHTEPDGWGAIFCGWTNNEPWIFEIDPAGTSGFHDVFAATGSGHPLAHAALMAVQHFKVEEKTLEAAEAIAYRTIENVCTASAQGVSMPVQMAVVTKSGYAMLEEGDEDHQHLSDLIDLWKAKEVETLGQFAPATAQDAPPDDTKPEPSIDPGEIDKPAS
jgi:proteasome beta subunit